MCIEHWGMRWFWINGWCLNQCWLLNSGAIWQLVISNWIEIVDFSACVTLKFTGWPRKIIGHFFYTTLSFVHHFKSTSEFKLELCSTRVEIDNILSRVTLKFDKWPWKSIGHISYAASSFVHHFIAIGKFTLELQSGNAQFGSKSWFFFSRVILKFDGWPWKTIGHLF